MKNFGGHLHTHTEYSVLDGMSNIKELLETAKELGQEFIAITDHGSMSGLWEAQKLSDEIGIKVILGCEFYYQRENDDGNGHLIVLAKDNVGLSNMYKLQEYAYVENFNRRARITFDKLVEYKEGLIITSACLASTLNQYLIEGEYAKAKQWAEKFKEEFGEDFYIEIQPNNIPEQLIVNKSAIRLAKELNIKTIATNDVHYTFKEDYFPHEILLAMQTNQKISSEKRFKFDTEDFWLKSEEEMYQSFHGIDKEDITSALKSTFEIANKCNARIEKGKYLPPYYNIPEGETERSVLVKKTIEGARKKGFITNKEYMKEVQEEIDIIDRNGYSGYFLIVQDYVNTARKNGIIVGDGRGSGVASKVGYLIDITRVEPNEHNLLFERFMADGRSPDSIESTDVETYQVKFSERMTKRCTS